MHPNSTLGLRIVYTSPWTIFALPLLNRKSYLKVDEILSKRSSLAGDDFGVEHC